jgi:hypothetical protein
MLGGTQRLDVVADVTRKVFHSEMPNARNGGFLFCLLDTDRSPAARLNIVPLSKGPSLALSRPGRNGQL